MDFYADLVVQILFLVMLAVSFNLLFGLAGETSMAHAAFYGVGAYVAGRLAMPAVEAVPGLAMLGGAGWNIVAATVVAVVASFVLASLISLPALSRVRGEYLILMTLAFQLVASQLMTSMTDVTGGAYGLTSVPPLVIFGVDLSTPTTAVWFLLAVTAAVALFSMWLSGSPFGRLLKGIRESDSAVMALGKDVVMPKLVIFGVAAAIAGMVGALNGFYYQFVAPGTYGLDASILILAIVVLGGAGNVVGSILGAILLGGLRPLLVEIVGDNGIAWQSVIYGLALVVIPWLRPNGLLPEGTTLRRNRSEVDGLERREHVSAEDRPRPPLRHQERESEESTGAAVLTVRGLVKSFGGIKAVSGVDLDLQPRRITGLLGPNGAGKTTVFNLVTNTIVPDEGEVLLRGKNLRGLSPAAIARLGMARSFQDGRLFTRESALANVATAIPDQPGERVGRLILTPAATARAERRTRQAALDALDFVGVADRADRLVAELSYGDQKLVAIARLLATGADILLLDEPTSGVDPSAVEDVITVVRNLRDAGRTICLVEHSVHMIEQLADHVVFMDQGAAIAEGTLADLQSQDRLTEIYFGN